MIDIIEVESVSRSSGVSMASIKNLVEETEIAFREAETILLDAARNYAKAEKNYERSLALLEKYKERSK